MLEIRLFRAGDAPDVSQIVVQCLREINSRDYPAEIIERMCAHFTAVRIEQLSRSRQMFVAVSAAAASAVSSGQTVVGTVSRDGNKVFTMFVRPSAIGLGVGRRLMAHIEALAAGEGYDFMETGASITAHGFYRRLGYVDVRTSETEFGFNYILRKPLSATG